MLKLYCAEEGIAILICKSRSARVEHLALSMTIFLSIELFCAFQLQRGLVKRIYLFKRLAPLLY